MKKNEMIPCITAIVRIIIMTANGLISLKFKVDQITREVTEVLEMVSRAPYTTE